MQFEGAGFLSRRGASVGRLWIAAALVVLVILSPGRAFSQVAGATLSGSIVDQQGDVLAGGTVSIKNVASGVVTDVVTNTSGAYTAPNLLPGTYEITAALSGFATVIRTGIVLTVGAQRVVDITMSVGPMTESVTVESPNVDNTTPTLSAVVGERTIVELPLNGRDWTTLATLQPGVSSIRTQFASGGTASRGNRGYGDSLSISGHRPQENNYRIDGVSINDYSNGAPGSAGSLNLGADAIREFSVLVTNYTAEYGRTSGGVINASTRSGTNKLHGSAYEFHRNDALDERGFFDPAPKPELKRHQFGASLGGPIAQNRTFFFVDYEGIRRNQGVTGIATVPSAAARRGELAAGRVSVDPAIAPFLAFWPQPNGPVLGNGDTAQYTTVLDQDLTENFVTARIDHQLSSGNTLFATYLFDDGEFTVPDALNNVSFPNTTRRQLAAAEWTRTLSPRFVNSVRVGFSQTKGGVNIAGPAFNPVAEDLALGSAPGRPAAIVQVPGLTPAISVGGNSFFDHTQNSYQAYDDAFLSLGHHALKLGLAFERIEYDLFGLRRQNGLASFGSLSAFLTNRPTSFFALDPTRSQKAEVRSNVLAAYADDHWRMTPKLSLNLGLRYEMSTVPKEAQGRFTAVRDLAGGPILNVSSFFTKNPTLRNFEPRVGLAYDVFGNGHTAVRGGFGIYDSLPLPWIFTPKVAQGTPFNVGTTVRNLEQGAFPGRIFGRINFNTVAGDSLFVETEPKRSYIMNWNLSLQHEVLTGLSAMVAYVGSRGNNQAFVTDDSNIVAPVAATPDGLGLWPSPAGSGTRVNPNAGSLRTNTWDGTNRYHGLQAQLIRQFKGGFQAQASYTWSRCTDDGSGASRNDQFLNGITTPIFFDRTKRHGRCDFDLTHVFVANALWNLPGPRAGLAKAVLGDWQLGGIVSASSGVPFSVIMSGDPLGLKGLDVNGWPDVVSSPECETLTNPGDHEHYLKTECFTVPDPITRLGNAGRNIVTGPGLFIVDMAVYKNISLSEGTRMQFRVEAFNLFNRVNFAAPLSNNAVFNQTGGALGNAGRITATQTPPRQIQLGLRLNW